MATVEHQNMIHKFICPFVKGDTIFHVYLFGQQQAQISATQPPEDQREQKTNDAPALPSAPAAPAGVGSGPRMLHIDASHVSVRGRLDIFLTRKICH